VTGTVAAEPVRDARLRECTILMVDDEPANLDLLEALLDSEGYGAAGGGRIVRTSDSREVLALAQAHAPDLVLLDLHMPHRHGLDVLGDLRAAGADAYLTKPLDVDEFLRVVERFLPPSGAYDA
jgi:CheY-like chemotaxis protein